LGLPGFDYESSQEVLSRALVDCASDSAQVSPGRLANMAVGEVDLTPASPEPVVASIYALDGIVRRASSLQMTADARLVAEAGASA
jgi:NADH-quinone oxidoreductase subunit G